MQSQATVSFSLSRPSLPFLPSRTQLLVTLQLKAAVRLSMSSVDVCSDLYLTRKIFRFQQTYMYEILVTVPLCTSECAGECRLSANLCKCALDVTAGVIVQATRDADMLTINASENLQ